MLDKLKKEFNELVEAAINVKIWVALNIPKVEDGNNFGVSVQVCCLLVFFHDGDC